MDAASGTIADFVRARLDEVEAAALAAFGPPRHGGANAAEEVTDMALSEGCDPVAVAHFERHGPARVLADVAAKRSLIQAAATIGEVMDGEWGCSHTAADTLAGARIRDGEDPVPLPSSCEGPKEMLRILGPIAALDATHPDYKQEWAP